MRFLYLAILLMSFWSSNVSAADPVFMSSDWGVEACNAWNQKSTLTTELGGDNWAGNDGERGFKILHLYRMDCGQVPTVELRIADQEDGARCVYGGAVENSDLIKKHDYVMFAKSSNWIRMGSGTDGPMKAMMLGRLKFKGPKWEAMKNMGPFGAFLRLTGEIKSDMESCP